MFSANTQLTVSELSFDKIKDSFKNFVKNKTEFEDYNFEGSTINYLLDILAYDTYMKSIYTNMAVNETYIDTAQVRSNLVSNAKKMGYVPKSAMAARARLAINIIPNDAPSQIVVPKGTVFQAVKDGVRYVFSTFEEYVIPRSSDGRYSIAINVYEGNFITQEYRYSSNTTGYEILNSNVDTSTLGVGVLDNNNSSVVSYYERVDDITTLDSSSQIYYLQENTDEHFEIYFGDGILGFKPPEDSRILITYITTTGSEANGIRVFSTTGFTGYNFDNPTKKYTASTVTTIENSNGGADKQDVESIRFSAINNFPIQGRLVTRKDFEDFVRINYPNIQSINVWGGEDNNPPIYGKTILCLKPFGAYALTEERKEAMIISMKKRNVLSIDPVIVDPTFTYVVPDIFVTYDSSRTTNSAGAIYNNISTAIRNYELNSLSNFGKTFRYSAFINMIDRADPSILSNKTTIKYEKRFTPILNTTLSYTILFDTPIDHPYDGYIGGLTSNTFKISSSTNVQQLRDDGFGKIQMFFFDASGQRVISNKNVGTVDYEKGIVKLNAISISEIMDGSIEIKLMIEPLNYELDPTKNNIILLATPLLRIQNNVDRQITQSGIVTVEGNISPIYSSSLSF